MYVHSLCINPGFKIHESHLFKISLPTGLPKGFGAYKVDAVLWVVHDFG